MDALNPKLARDEHSGMAWRCLLVRGVECHRVRARHRGRRDPNRGRQV